MARAIRFASRSWRYHLPVPGALGVLRRLSDRDRPGGRLSDRDRPGGVLAFDPRQGWCDFRAPVPASERLWLGTPVERIRRRDHVVWDRVDRMLDFGGIRIEDNVLITEAGHDVITADVPRGQINPQLLAAAGVDLDAQGVIRAARACVPASGGAVTQAAISQATWGR